MSGVEIYRSDPPFAADIEQFVAARPANGNRGTIQLSVNRNRSILKRCGAGSSADALFVARKFERVVGAASLTTFQGFIGAQSSPQTIGVLGNLRIDSAIERGSPGSVLLAGIRALNSICNSDVIPLLAVVMHDNPTAITAFARPRRYGLLFHSICQINTFVIPPRRVISQTTYRSGKLNIRCASPSDIPRLVSFLQKAGKNKEFFPCYQESDFLGGSIRYPGLDCTDILIAEYHGEIVGSVGIWDQSKSQKWYISGYSRALSAARPLYNLFSAAFGGVRLPPSGENIPYRMAVCLTAAGNDKQVFDSLLTAARCCCADFDDRPVLIIALAQPDPLTAIARRAAFHRFSSQLFQVRVQTPNRPAPPVLTVKQVPFLEVGAL